LFDLIFASAPSTMSSRTAPALPPFREITMHALPLYLRPSNLPFRFFYHSGLPECTNFFAFGTAVLPDIERDPNGHRKGGNTPKYRIGEIIQNGRNAEKEIGVIDRNSRRHHMAKRRLGQRKPRFGVSGEVISLCSLGSFRPIAAKCEVVSLSCVH